MSATDTLADPGHESGRPSTQAANQPPGLDAPADTGLRPTAAAAPPHRAGAVLADPRADRDRPGLARHLRHREPRHPLGVRRPGRHRHRRDAAGRRVRRPSRRPDRPGTRLVARPARHQHRRRRDRRHGRQPRAPGPAQQPRCAGRQLPHLERLDPGRPEPDARRSPRSTVATSPCASTPGRSPSSSPRASTSTSTPTSATPARSASATSPASGFDQSVNTDRVHVLEDPGRPTLDLDLDARVGSISVEEVP